MGTQSYTRFAQHWVRDVSKPRLNQTSQLKSFLSGLSEHNERSKKNHLKSPELYLVVATLVTAVSFSAAFTMPGGYKTDGVDKGKPIFAGKFAFKGFVFFDSVSFLTSMGVVFFQNGTPFSERIRASNQLVQAMLLVIALVALALAFVSGLYATLFDSPIGNYDRICIKCSFFHVRDPVVKLLIRLNPYI